MSTPVVAPEMLRAEIRRAVRECFPDRAEQMIKEMERREREVEVVLLQLAVNGIPADMNPTNSHMWHWSDWTSYLNSASQAVRETASLALAQVGINAEEFAAELHRRRVELDHIRLGIERPR